MKLSIQVTLTSDDGTQSISTVNEVSVATCLPGLDPASAKQDFINQAENLIRIIGDNQIPAMYADILNHLDATPVDNPPTDGEKALHDKLKALKARKDEKDADPAETQEEEAE